jgi:hypothetical protein
MATVTLNQDVVGIADADTTGLATTTYVDSFVKTFGASQTIYVDKKGNDSTGTGTIDNPFLTYNAAKAFAISLGLSASVDYLIKMGPGDYSEIAPVVIPQYLNIEGSGTRNTFLFSNDSSPITYSYGGSSDFTALFKDITFSSTLNFTRQVGQTVQNTRIDFMGCQMPTTTNITGSGNTGTGPFIFDIFQFIGCFGGSVLNANAINLISTANNFLNVNITDAGVDTYVTPASGGLSQTLLNSKYQFLTMTGLVGAAPRNSGFNRVTLNGIAPTFAGDAVSHVGNATNVIVLNSTREISTSIFSQSGSFYDVVGAAKAIQLFNTSTGHYFWFKVTDGINTQTDPVLTGTGHQVDILSADTSAQVATKFHTAVAAVSAAFTSVNTIASRVDVTNVTSGASTDASASGSAATVTISRQGDTALVSQVSKTNMSHRLKNSTTTVTAATYSINFQSDYVISCNRSTSGTVTLTWPSTVSGSNWSESQQFLIIDRKGDAGTNAIILVCSGTDTFWDGTTSKNIVTSNFGWALVHYLAGKLYLVSSSDVHKLNGLTNSSSNTPSTVVSRDSSGNFEAGTVTAALIGSASNNVLKAGDTMTGKLKLKSGTHVDPFEGPTVINDIESNSNDINDHQWSLLTDLVKAFFYASGSGSGGNLYIGTSSNHAIEMQANGLTVLKLNPGGATNLYGALDLNTNLITNVASPLAETDAVNRGYADNIAASEAATALAKIAYYDTPSSVGGSSQETFSVSGLAATDTVLNIFTKNYGSTGQTIVPNSWANLGTNTIDIKFTADPGSGGLYRIVVKKA